MTRKMDKYGRRVEEKIIYAKDYKVGPEVRSHTLWKKDLRTGRFTGRYPNVHPRFSDNTRYIRVVRPIDVNHDKIPDLHVGQVIGRMKRGTTEKPPYIKVKVYVNDKKSLEAMKETQKEKFKRIIAGIKKGDGRLVWW